MPAPIAKGLIIAASIIAAASLALYENPQVREWVDNSRRKIAMALHSLGEDIEPTPRQRSWGDEDEGTPEQEASRRKRREDLIRRNRLALVRRAQEEGVAVDLDELAAIGRDVPLGSGRADRNRNFSDIVGSDGMLRTTSETAEASGSTNTAAEGLRNRSNNAVLRGASFANPFADEMGGDADVLFDTRDGAKTPTGSRETTATVAAEDPPISPPVTLPVTTLEQEMSVLLQQEALDSAQWGDSFHSAASDAGSDPFTSLHALDTGSPDTLPAESPDTPSTPRNLDDPLTPSQSDGDFEDGYLTAGSVVGTQASDVGIISSNPSESGEMDVDMMSETGESTASTDSFSEVGSRAGVSTPGSWSEIGSDDGQSEHGHA
ncbi:hypothetical protein K402DRAFT_387888 [Aulographum hederae CBS 113979]|uniref:Uncharacterized protein n=1 Tax=Aulographum hederae CBS 113979 TaxID=1176131 RepID=A0A6G1HGS2_9PEZI|nr:hypothetical protein K402DRAFT_387888 [Aulographum hederae CBS 113979]